MPPKTEPFGYTRQTKESKPTWGVYGGEESKVRSTNDLGVKKTRFKVGASLVNDSYSLPI